MVAGFQIEQTCKKEGESVEQMKRSNQSFQKSLTFHFILCVCVFIFTCKWVAKTEEIGERRNDVEDFNESGKLATNSGSFQEAFILAWCSPGKY